MLNVENLEGAGWLAGLAAAVKGLAYFRRDKNKEMDVDLAKQKLALQADEQNAVQEERLIPHFQQLLKEVQTELSELRSQIRDANSTIDVLTRGLAQADAKVLILESQVATLTINLHASQLKHGEYEAIIKDKDKLIADLQRQISPIKPKYAQ